MQKSVSSPLSLIHIFPFIKLDDIDDVKDDLAKGGCKPGVCGPRAVSYTHLDVYKR